MSKGQPGNANFQEGMDKRTSAWIDHLNQLPKPPQPKFDRLDTVEQCGCGSMAPLRKFSLAESGCVTYLNNICHDCPRMKELAEMATIICAHCKRVSGRMEPARDPTGFTFKSGEVYHTEFCPICKPGLTSSPIIEKLLYDRNRGA